MLTYLYCGLPVVSNINLPELDHASLGKLGYSFFLKSPFKQITGHAWLHHWCAPGGERLLSYSREGCFHWLRFPGLADFCLSADAKDISCYPVLETSQESIQHLLLDQVLPRCLAYDGKVMLHASAVQLEQGLVLFLGDSGAGKSTLAGNFHQMGNPAVSDDCLWIKKSRGQIVAVPSYGGLRLWDDSVQALFSAENNTWAMAGYSAKKRVSLEPKDRLKPIRGMPVLAVIVLTPPDQVSTSEILLERLSKRETFIAMLKQSFHLNVTDLERMTHHMRALGRMVPRVPAYRLSMPREYDLLPRVRQRILETIGVIG